MNRQIEHLAIQAGINLVPAQFSGIPVGVVDEFTIERFAKLIVQECARIAVQEDYDPAECILNKFQS